MSTNVNFYVSAFDREGRRIASTPAKKDDAKAVEKMKENFPEAEVIEVIPSEYFLQYLKGFVRGADGKPHPYIPPVPSESEMEKKKADELASVYQNQLKELQDAMVTAMLSGNEALVEDLKVEYKDVVAEYKKALKGE